MKPLGKKLSIISLLGLIFLGVLIFSGFSLVYAEPNDGFHHHYRVGTQNFFVIEEDFARKALLDLKLPKYVIKKGDVLSGISRYSFTSINSIQQINKILNPHKLIAGQILYLPPPDKSQRILRRYWLRKGDSIETLLQDYHLTNWQFWRLNPGLESLKAGEMIYLPKIPPKEKRGQKLQICLMRPLRGFVTSRFGNRWGRMHYGVDFAAPFGTPVKAAENGKIVYAGWMGSYGLLVIINHGTFKTYYGHLSKIFVRKHSPVLQGEVIGKVGATGRAYGCHLHFEVERNGVKVNPYQYIEKSY